ncbi:DUF2919 domain-containing protein [Kosakonia sp. MUSA4]|uniref:DUF2919 domain-containing protein n=1 Tax=Kosakonia sp. MUSA4 TaxID=2067958 RepID=UPI0015985CD7|nr:DUF2919 domain-containing protein [Kosakonia sp. MUSA4]QJT81890.1 hypothetical protein C0557_18340 [Kosakonia sp. MUSA4]
MKSIDISPSDYDRHGRLRLPFLFWCALVLQARTWILFVMAGASRGQGDALLTLFYPDHNRFWLGLLPGLPAALAFFLSARREHHPRLWRAIYPLLLLVQLALVLWQPSRWFSGEALSGIGLSLLVIDLFILWWLATSRRLRACFYSSDE